MWSALESMLCLLLHFKATSILNFPKIHSCKDIQNEWDKKNTVYAFAVAIFFSVKAINQ